MYREMEAAGLPEPEYHTVEFMLYATLRNHKWVEEHRTSTASPPASEVSSLVLWIIAIISSAVFPVASYW